MQEDPHVELQLVEEELLKVEADIQHLLARQQQLTDDRERLKQRCSIDERAPKADWQGTFEWDSRVKAALHILFGLNSFRPLQREVINASLQGRDCLCLLPAGGGKSLCYQLPAMMKGSTGVTLVVSPLLSLIHDQVSSLQSMGIQASALTSLTSKDEALAVNELLDDPKSGLRLLYCTPEKIVNSKRFLSRLEKMYKAGRLARIAIDEAHCCSEWGNDFRPDYKKLGVLKQQFPDTPLLALTATATHTVCGSLQSILRIEGCEVFRGSTNRPNLYYEVRPKPASSEALADELAGWVLQNYPDGDSGIVYCLTRKDCEQLSQQLRERRVRCAFYHADMEPATRQSVHSMWSQGKLQLIVATIAFGMGINKTDVRFVVHHSLSKSLENYYQESGRAGRDGRLAHCRVYFRLGDYMRQAGIVVMESSWERHLNAMLRYVTAHTCRRSLLSRHFDEASAPCHGMCDVCKTEPPQARDQQLQDVTDAATGALSTLARHGQEKRATLAQLVDKWRSNKEGAHGAAAKAMTKEENEAVLQHMLLEGSLQLDFGFTAYATNVYLKAGPKAGSILQGKRRMIMPHWRARVSDRRDSAVKPQPSNIQISPCNQGGSQQQPEGGAQPAKGPIMELEGRGAGDNMGEDNGATTLFTNLLVNSAQHQQQVVDLLSSDSEEDSVEGSLGKKRQRKAR